MLLPHNVSRWYLDIPHEILLFQAKQYYSGGIAQSAKTTLSSFAES